jgi:formylglycine-generating enzyme required for sulfatase activity
MRAGQLVTIRKVSFDKFRFIDISMNFSYIPAGTFMMGSPDSDTEAFEFYKVEKPQHQVTITKPFLMMRTPVTQEQWFAVMGTDPSWFKGPRRPVESVSWFDAVNFCNSLSTRSGLPHAYVIEGGDVRLVENPIGYRLPTEAEWEYACRAWTTDPRYGQLDDVAWYAENSGSQTHDVGQKKPNAWGLYDMLGNVSEWVWDWYGKYSAGHQTDPQGPASGSRRVVRGGSWGNGASDVRAGDRPHDPPGSRYFYLGFRVCRSL